MTKNTLYNLFNAYEEDIKPDEEMAKIVSGLRNKLQGRLNKDGNALLNKYDDAMEEQGELLSYTSFKHGFRASVLLMLEVMQS